MSDLPEAAVHAANAAAWLMVCSHVGLDEAIEAAKRVAASGTIAVSSRNVAEAWVDPIRSEVINARRERNLVRLDIGFRKAAIESSRATLAMQQRSRVQQQSRGKLTNVYELGLVRAGLSFGDALPRAIEVSRRSARDVAAMARRKRKASNGGAP